MTKHLVPAYLLRQKNRNINIPELFSGLGIAVPEQDILLIYFFMNSGNFQNIRLTCEETELLRNNTFRNIYILSELKKIYELCACSNIKPPALIKGCSHLLKIALAAGIASSWTVSPKW